jgi:hypothetical protein
MKKLIITDMERICGLDLGSGTLDEKHKCMGYDNRPRRSQLLWDMLNTLVVRKKGMDCTKCNGQIG